MSILRRASEISLGTRHISPVTSEEGAPRIADYIKATWGHSEGALRLFNKNTALYELARDGIQSDK